MHKYIDISCHWMAICMLVKKNFMRTVLQICLVDSMTSDVFQNDMNIDGFEQSIWQ